MMRAVLLCGVVACLVGCQLGYYGQAIKGLFGVMSQREPIADVLADPQLSATLRSRLVLSQQVLAFADEYLMLPADDVYVDYVALEQDAIVWNVLAAPADSLTPKTWCYPVAGCVSYRGYFSAQAAQREAQKLADDGWEVYVGEAIAYSTLGWFADPLTTPMLRRSEPALVDLLLHELAHRKLYVKHATRFNESLATFVGQAGAEAFFAHYDTPLPADFWQKRQAWRATFIAQVNTLRQGFETLYAQPLAVPQREQEKTRLRELAREQWRRLVADEPELARYSAFFDGPLNNAQLNAVSDYHAYVPAFAQLYTQCQASWQCFWQQVDNLTHLSVIQRETALRGLSQ